MKTQNYWRTKMKSKHDIETGQYVFDKQADSVAIVRSIDKDVIKLSDPERPDRFYYQMYYNISDNE